MKRLTTYQMKFNKILPVLFVTALVFSACTDNGPKAPGKYADVAQCLTQKGVIMYGAYWCPHCQNQKAAFGDDFQYATYQECDDAGKGGNHKLCLEAGVTSYPTWFFPGQGNLVGEYPVWALAKAANCQDKLPQEDKDLLKQAEDKADQTSTPSAPTGQTVPVGTPTPVNPENK